MNATRAPHLQHQHALLQLLWLQQYRELHINTIQNGGKFLSSFASGFVSSAFSIGKKTFGEGAVAARTAVMALVGGVTSSLTGGKFLNGAVSAAFVHLFNAEASDFRHQRTKSKNVFILLDEKKNPALYHAAQKLEFSDNTFVIVAHGADKDMSGYVFLNGVKYIELVDIIKKSGATTIKLDICMANKGIFPKRLSGDTGLPVVASDTTVHLTFGYESIGFVTYTDYSIGLFVWHTTYPNGEVD